MEFGFLNPERATEAYTAFRILQDTADRSGAKLEIEQNRKRPDMVVVRLTGEHIIFDNAQVLYDVSSVSSNFEVYARTDGKICMAFTFYGVVVWTNGEDSK